MPDTVSAICLGSGTSHGVPMIGCTCPVCLSDDPKNRRTRASLFVRAGGANLLIDTATELRLQVLRHGINRVDAVLYTHDHADHLHGIDDLRTFTQLQRTSVPIYAAEQTLASIRNRLPYIFGNNAQTSGKNIPRLSMHTLRPAMPETICGVQVTPIPLMHGDAEILGYRIGALAYLTDCSAIPATSMALLQDLDTLIIDGLRPRPHRTHFSIDQAIEASRHIGPKETYLTHLTHDVDHEQTEAALPPGIHLAYDGLCLNIPG